MILSTSNSKKIRAYLGQNIALIAAVLFILVVEAVIFYCLKDRDFSKNISKNALFNMNFMYRDAPSRNIIGYKNNNFSDSKADVIMIGDSSGFINVQPLIVNKYIFPHELISLSYTATARWDGYLAIANNYLKYHSQVKYLLIYISPNSLPFLLEDKKTDDEIHLTNLYLSHWYYLYQLPSTYFRKNLLEKIYHYQGEGEAALDHNIKALSYGEYDNYEKFLIDHLGWAPSSKNLETIDKTKINFGVCNLKLLKENQKTDFYKLLKKAKNFADDKKVKLILAFAPMSCKKSEDTDKFFNVVKSFKEKNPDIFIVDEALKSRDRSDFIDEDHLNIKGSESYSQDFGKKLSDLIN